MKPCIELPAAFHVALIRHWPDSYSTDSPPPPLPKSANAEGWKDLCNSRRSQLLTSCSTMYELEESLRLVDTGLLLGSKSSCFGTRQPNIPLDHRKNIIIWMAEACKATTWGYTSFYTAVYAFDSYILTVPHLIDEKDLGPLASSCLYFGARTRETSSDRNLLSVDEFRKICPQVGSSYTIRMQEAHLIDTLKGASIGNRTPHDLGQLWIAQMHFNDTTKLLYELMESTGTLQHCFNCILQVSNSCILNGLSLCMPASSWIAATLVLIAESLLQQVRRMPSMMRRRYLQLFLCGEHKILRAIAEEICDYPGGLNCLVELCSLYRPLIEEVFQNMPGRVQTLVSGDATDSEWEVNVSIRKKLLPVLKRCAATQNSPQLETHSRHRRRHTNVCACSQCQHYIHNPPTWFRRYEA